MSMIITESIVITAISGYLGLVCGIMLLEWAPSFLPDVEMFRNPSVDLSIATIATLVLIAAGTTAGMIPAWHAASIKPVVALRDE